MRFVLSALCLCVMLSGCSNPAPAPAPPTPTLTEVLLSYGGSGTDGDGNLLVGKTTQFMAFARLSDGSGRDITSVATWQTANAAVATVSAGGTVQGVAKGATAVIATYQGLAGSLNVAVVP